MVYQHLPVDFSHDNTCISFIILVKKGCHKFVNLKPRGLFLAAVEAFIWEANDKVIALWSFHIDSLFIYPSYFCFGFHNLFFNY